MDDYKDIKELLRPRRDIKASDELRRKVGKALERDRRNRIARKWLYGGISLTAVAALLLLVIVPSGLSAKEVLAGR